MTLAGGDNKPLVRVGLELAAAWICESQKRVHRLGETVRKSLRLRLPGGAGGRREQQVLYRPRHNFHEPLFLPISTAQRSQLQASQPSMLSFGRLCRVLKQLLYGRTICLSPLLAPGEDMQCPVHRHARRLAGSKFNEQDYISHTVLAPVVLGSTK